MLEHHRQFTHPGAMLLLVFVGFIFDSSSLLAAKKESKSKKDRSEEYETYEAFKKGKHSKNSKPKEKSTHGMLSKDPKWSTGLQIGNYGATGVSAQKPGWYSGALNTGAGLANGSIAIYADYVFFLDEDLKPLKLESPGYLKLRGKVTPYFGAGIQVGKGLQIEAPAGIQYTMLKDPLNFYGGATVLYGRFFTKTPLEMGLWFQLGARILL